MHDVDCLGDADFDTNISAAIVSVDAAHHEDIVQTEDDAERVINHLGRLEILGRALKELKASAKEAVCQWIRRNGNLVIVGTTAHYYVGTKKLVKCKDVSLTMARIADIIMKDFDGDQMMDKAGGDLDGFEKLVTGYVTERLSGYISKDKTKTMRQGACKDLLGEEEWNNHFEVTDVTELREGKATLQKFDTKFLPAKEPNHADVRRLPQQVPESSRPDAGREY